MLYLVMFKDHPSNALFQLLDNLAFLGQFPLGRVSVMIKSNGNEMHGFPFKKIIFVIIIDCLVLFFLFSMLLMEPKYYPLVNQHGNGTSRFLLGDTSSTRVHFPLLCQNYRSVLAFRFGDSTPRKLII